MVLIVKVNGGNGDGGTIDGVEVWRRGRVLYSITNKE